MIMPPQLTKQEKEVIQGRIQQEAFDAWVANQRRGLVAAATGTGKFRVGVMAALELAADYPDWKPGDDADIMWIEPTEDLRDRELLAEFQKWDAMHLLPRVYPVCYASLPRIKKRKFRLVVGDEFHHMTDARSKFFEFNMPERIMALTATVPNATKEESKADLVSRLTPTVFVYTKDQGVEDGILPDYRIWVIDVNLDDTRKIIPSGTKAKPFMTTEKKYYEYLGKMIKLAATQGNWPWKESLVNKRAAFLRTCMTAQWTAEKILAKIALDQRVIIFAGGKEQAEALCPNFYHSESGDEHLSNFMKKLVKRIAAVKMMNEGINVPELDAAVIASCDSGDREIIQRTGRFRWREDHVSQIFVVSITGTRSEVWVDEALSSFNQDKIKHYSAKNL